MAQTLLRPLLTGPSPTDEPRQDSAVRLPLRSTLVELLVGPAVAAVLSLVMQVAIAQISISEPSNAPKALASTGAALVLAAMFVPLFLGHYRSPRWLRLGGSWVALTSFTTLALAIPLQSTRFYFGGASADNAFRMQYMTRMASSPALADMNYVNTAPYYPGGWFWLGGRFANLLGWEGWAAYKPYALIWVAVTSVVAFTLWSVVVRRRLALLAALATTLAGMLHGVEEPYGWPAAAWLAPIAVLAWHVLRHRQNAPRWVFVLVGGYVGFAAITYTLYFGFAVLMIIVMAVINGISRVRSGMSLGGTVKLMFFRLVPIGIVSGLIALLVWMPYVISTDFFLHNPHGAALRYLPSDGAFIPVPMADATPFGALCLAGFLWMLIRFRRNEIAVSLLTVVVSIYVWFALSTLALVAKTTLLAFRLNVILGAVLAAAGVLGLLELIGFARRKIDLAYALQISLVAGALGLVGAITLTQGAIGTALAGGADAAYADYYPTGDNAKGERDPAKAGHWAQPVYRTISQLTDRKPEQNILLTTDYKLMSFQPYWGFQQETPHYANPLAHYDDRAAVVKQWTTARTGQELQRMLDNSPFTAPNVFVFRHTGGLDMPGRRQPNPDELALELKGDAFPQNPNVRDYDVFFRRSVFDAPQFVQRDVGPYTVIVRR